MLGDIVGEGHELIANTIAVYNVNKPINEDGSRNLNNDGYNYDISALLQQKSTITANGFTYTDDDFNGFPKLDGLKEKNTKAYYIIYETKVVDSDQEWLKNDVYLEGIIAEPGNGGDPLPFTENSSVSISTISSGGGGTEVGSIEFIKVDSETKAPLANAEFVIKDGEGNIVQTILTNEDGKGTALDLLYGSYTLEETKAPIGYTLEETPYPFEINDSEKAINLGEVTNQKIMLPAPTGSIEFIKVDSETKSLDGLTIKNTKTTNLQMNLPQSGENNKVGQRIKIVGLLLVFISIYLYVSRLKKRVNLKY